MLKSHETALGDAGDQFELFATEELFEIPLECIEGIYVASFVRRSWKCEHRSDHFLEDDIFRCSVSR